jgi:hypothetical protein
MESLMNGMRKISMPASAPIRAALLFAVLQS